MRSIQNQFQKGGNVSYAGANELWVGEQYLTKYNTDLVSLFTVALSKSPDVLEFGAGIGTLARIWRDKNGSKPECLEIDPVLRSEIISRGFTCYDSISSVEKKFSGIYTSNVLEHIEDDVDVMKMLHNLLRDQCNIAIYVPAFMCLYSDLDAYVGHYRRYSKVELCEKLRKANFSIVSCEYVDSIGFFAWAYTKIKRKSSKKLGGERQLLFYDRYLYPLSRFLDYIGFKYFFGKNIFVVAKKDLRRLN